MKSSLFIYILYVFMFFIPSVMVGAKRKIRWMGQGLEETTPLEDMSGMGYLQLWVNYADIDKREPVIKIGGHVITKLILTVESVCAQPVGEGQPCTDLDMSDLVDIDDTLDGVQINLLQVLDNEPVFFSKFAIPLGTYWDVELNLVPDMQFIHIDGTTYPLNLSNEGYTLILFGKYTLDAEGGLFNLYFDFVASENLAFMPGIGYTLRSALLLNQEEPLREISGCYHGKIPYMDICGILEPARLILGLNYFQMTYSILPDISITGFYSYDSYNKILKLKQISAQYNVSCDFADLFCWGVKKRIDDFFIPIIDIKLKEWDSTKIFGSICANDIYLYRKTESTQCTLPEQEKPTIMNIAVSNISPEWNKSILVIEIRREDDRYRPITKSMEINNLAIINTNINIPNGYFLTDTTTFQVNGFIVNSSSNAYISPETGGLVGMCVASTLYPNAPSNVFNTKQGSNDNYISIQFQQTLNIHVDPPDLSSPNIEITWSSYPGVNYYQLKVVTRDLQWDDDERIYQNEAGTTLRHGDGDPFFDILYQIKTTSTHVAYNGKKIDTTVINSLGHNPAKTDIPIREPIKFIVAGYDADGEELITGVLSINREKVNE